MRGRGLWVGLQVRFCLLEDEWEAYHLSRAAASMAWLGMPYGLNRIRYIALYSSFGLFILLGGRYLRCYSWRSLVLAKERFLVSALQPHDLQPCLAAHLKETRLERYNFTGFGPVYIASDFTQVIHGIHA
jgi:hypothetical protein